MSVLDSSKPYCKYFEEICAIPHGSYNEKAISDYLVDFAKKHNLKAIQDEMWNVVIYKDASVGKEDVAPVILQAHMDMVAEKNDDTNFDFKTDSLNLYVEDGWLHARGTTLGADDGSGVAYILAILADDTITHPAIEATFTVQEEVGLCGAMALKKEYFKGKYLINLDGGPEGCTCISNSGGMRVSTTTKITKQENTLPTYQIFVSGLLGGHSGGLINKRRANANKVLAQVLWNLNQKYDYSLVSINGGLKENAIPRESKALIATNADVTTIQQDVATYQEEFRKAYSTTDAALTITVTPVETSPVALSKESKKDVLSFVYLTPDGLQQMSADVDGLPIVSLNLGVLNTKEEVVEAHFSIRSPIELEKKNLCDKIEGIGAFTNTTCEKGSNYVGWDYEPNSRLRDLLQNVTQEVIHKDLVMQAIHGGLETGVFKGMIPDLDIVTMGPMSENCHTPNERLNLESFDTAYTILVKLVESI